MKLKTEIAMEIYKSRLNLNEPKRVCFTQEQLLKNHKSAIDAGDNDLAKFFEFLMAALDKN